MQIIPLNPQSPCSWILQFRNLMASAPGSHPSTSLRPALPLEVHPGVTGSSWVSAAFPGRPVASSTITPAVLYGSVFSEAFLRTAVQFDIVQSSITSASGITSVWLRNRKASGALGALSNILMLLAPHH